MLISSSQEQKGGVGVLLLLVLSASTHSQGHTSSRQVRRVKEGRGTGNMSSRRRKNDKGDRMKDGRKGGGRINIYIGN